MGGVLSQKKTSPHIETIPSKKVISFIFGICRLSVIFIACRCIYLNFMIKLVFVSRPNELVLHDSIAATVSAKYSSMKPT